MGSRSGGGGPPADRDGPTPGPRSAADRLATPWWYHPWLGVVLALLITSFAAASTPLLLTAVALCAASLYLLPRAYRRSTGVWLDGEVPPAARNQARALGRTCTGGVVLGLVVSGVGPLRPLAYVMALVVLVLVQVLGRRYDALLRSAVREDPGSVHLDGD